MGIIYLLSQKRLRIYYIDVSQSVQWYCHHLPLSHFSAGLYYSLLIVCYSEKIKNNLIIYWGQLVYKFPKLFYIPNLPFSEWSTPHHSNTFARLITWRSHVRVLPPQLRKPVALTGFIRLPYQQKQHTNSETPILNSILKHCVSHRFHRLT